jgi:UDP-N-acetylmuramoylalanine--D-glutamate ligase
MLESLRGKKIVVLGLGVNNRHLAAYLTRHNIDHDVIQDWESIKDLEGRLSGYDVVFRTPGVPFLSPVIQEAARNGTVVHSQTKLFFDICPCPIIGVTGTKGKGTTSTLIYDILKTAGKKAWLAGNIGRDPFEFVDELSADDLVVLELSSFQLQDLHKSPHIAVLLNITPDHVNPELEMSIHHSFEEYLEAKTPILRFQYSQDFAVLHPDLPETVKSLGEGKKIFINRDEVANMSTKLLGVHNRENISAAVAVARILKIDEQHIAEAIAQTEPLPHRLQIVAKKDGITYVDDSISTNVDSTIAAVQTFNKSVLILGGFDKGNDFTPLGAFAKSSDKIRGVVAVGDVTSKILTAFKGFDAEIKSGATSMKEIVSQARELAQEGDVILLSPATSSFDMFKDYKDRGEQFLKEATA